MKKPITGEERSWNLEVILKNLKIIHTSWTFELMFVLKFLVLRLGLKSRGLMYPQV